MPCYPRPHTARSPASLRPLAAELSPLARSDGSASLKAGNTHVLCAVHGPAAPRSARWELYDRGVVSVAFSRGLMAQGAGAASSTVDEVGGAAAAVEGGNDGESNSASNVAQTSTMKAVAVPPPPGLGATERELERFLRDALSSCILLERYPRCVIQVVVQIVQSDGSVLGSAVNCAVLALMDAGVAMKGLPVASTCAVIPSAVGEGSGEATIWLDPTAEEEAGEGHAIAVHVTDMAATPATDKGDGIITSMTFGAPLSLKGLLASVEGSKASSAALVAFMRLAVEQKVQREVQTLWS
ncbi:hypothetical protein ACHAXT_007631 [Thalassiosira profunda]